MERTGGEGGGVGSLLSSYYDVGDGAKNVPAAGGTSEQRPEASPSTAPEAATAGEVKSRRRQSSAKSEEGSAGRPPVDGRVRVGQGKRCHEGERAKGKRAGAVDLDSSEFELDAYFNDVVNRNNLKEVLDESNRLASDLKAIDAEMQSLIYENYSKFINTTDTVRSMRSSVHSMESRVEGLSQAMVNIQEISGRLESVLAGRARKIEELVAVRQLLSRLQFVLELPRSMIGLISESKFKEALEMHLKCASVLRKHSAIPGMTNLAKKADTLAARCRGALVACLEQQVVDAPTSPSSSTCGGEEPTAASALAGCEDALAICRVLLQHYDALGKAGSAIPKNGLLKLFLAAQTRALERLISQVFSWESLAESCALPPVGDSPTSDSLSSPPSSKSLLTDSDVQRLAKLGAGGIATVVACDRTGKQIVPLLVAVVSGAEKAFGLDCSDAEQNEERREGTRALRDFLTHALHHLWVRILLLASKTLFAQPEFREWSVPGNEPSSGSEECPALTAALHGVAQGLNGLREALKKLHVVMPDLLADTFANFIVTTGRLLCGARFLAAIGNCASALFRLERRMEMSTTDVAAKSTDNSLHPCSSESVPWRSVVTEVEREILLQCSAAVTGSHEIIGALVGPKSTGSREALCHHASRLADFALDAVSLTMKLASGDTSFDCFMASASTGLDLHRDLLLPAGDSLFTQLLRQLPASLSLTDGRPRDSAPDLVDVILMQDAGVQQAASACMAQAARTAAASTAIGSRTGDRAVGERAVPVQLAFVRIARHLEVKGISSLRRITRDYLGPHSETSDEGAHASAALVTKMRLTAQGCLNAYVATQGASLAKGLAQHVTALAALPTTGEGGGVELPTAVSKAAARVLEALLEVDGELSSLLGEASSANKKATAGSESSSGTRSRAARSHALRHRPGQCGRSPVFCITGSSAGELDSWSVQILWGRRTPTFVNVEDVAFNKEWAHPAILRIVFKALLEDVRNNFFGAAALQQLHLDCAFMSEAAGAMSDSADTSASLDVCLQKVLMSACQQCLEVTVDSSDDSFGSLNGGPVPGVLSAAMQTLKAAAQSGLLLNAEMLRALTEQKRGAILDGLP